MDNRDSSIIVSGTRPFSISFICVGLKYEIKYMKSKIRDQKYEIKKQNPRSRSNTKPNIESYAWYSNIGSKRSNKTWNQNTESKNIRIKYRIGIRTKTQTRDIGLEPKPSFIIGTNTWTNTGTNMEIKKMTTV